MIDGAVGATAGRASRAIHKNLMAGAENNQS
jgi:hypothetical protein